MYIVCVCMYEHTFVHVYLAGSRNMIYGRWLYGFENQMHMGLNDSSIVNGFTVSSWPTGQQ